MNTSHIAANNYNSPSKSTSSILLIHITLSLATSCALLPLVFILKQRAHRLRTGIKILTSFTIALGTIFGFFQRNSFHSISHSLLGYLIFLFSMVYLVGDIWFQKIPSTTLALWKFLSKTVEIIIPFLLYAEIIFGFIAIFNFCAYPYTQQCIGHFGIGSLFLLYFSFQAWLLLSTSHPHSNPPNTQTFYQYRPEILDAIFIVPGGLGLALFGHAWGYGWDNESLQHVFLGILSAIGALLGAWLSTDSDGQPRRNIFPGLVAIVAGYTFLAHPAKHISLLGELHQGLGFLISSIGATRILDVVFVTYRSGDSSVGKGGAVGGPWNFLGSYAGISAGLFIITANEETADRLAGLGVHGATVFMGLLAASIAVLGYVSVISVLSRALKTREYARIEMEEI